MGRAWRVIGVGLLVVAGLGVQPHALGAQAAPTLSVEPGTDLVDGQSVRVRGDGFPIDTMLFVIQCGAGATSLSGCEQPDRSTVSDDGHLDESFTVWGVLHLTTGEVDCRQPDACVMAVFGYDADTSSPVELARAPLHLDPDGPLAPPPVLAVAPAAELVDGQVVHVAGSGYVHASFLVVMQCRTGVTDWSDCDWSTEDFVDTTDGAFETDQRLFARITTDDGATVDCRVAGSCVLAALTGTSSEEAPTAVPLHFDPDGPLQPPPSLTVTPAVDLLDGQTVRLAGAGFLREASVRVLQCAPAEPSFDRCRISGPNEGYVEVADDGTVSTDLTLSAQLSTPEGVVDCRTSPQPCVVLATASLDDPMRAGRAELRFDPDGPLLPPPTITATPHEGLGDFTSVSVTGARFTPGVQVPVQVCTAGAPRRCDELNGESPTADADGRISTEFALFATFAVPDAEPGGAATVDCRVAPGCTVEARDPERGLAATAPVQFGPPDPPLGRYRDPVFDDVEVVHDVVYRQTVDYRGNPVELALDVYLPAGDTASERPAVVWLYGGWFKFGDKSDFYIVDYATETARRGYVAVAPNYRVRPDLNPGNWADVYAAGLDAYDDSVAAAQWLQEHAADYGIDPDAIAASGVSAGGATALSMAYLPGDRGPATSPIAAALPIVGAIATDVDAGEPPSIVFRATHDTVLGPLNNSDTVCPAAAAVGVACEYVQYDGDNHLDTPARWQDILRRGTDFVSEQVLGPLGYFDVEADAGGPYQVDEGDVVELDGGGAGSGPTYGWSPAERVSDPSSPTPTLAGIDDGTETVTLTVTNRHDIAGSDTAQVTTRNVAPTVASASVTTPQLGSRSVTLGGTVTDPGAADTHTATVDWGDGVVQPATVVPAPGGASLSAAHDYTVGGRYPVTVTVTDDDGGTATWRTDVVAGCTIVGSERGDVLLGTDGADVICGLGGADLVLGLGGDDTILGGAGHDVLLGGRGDDVLHGEAGWDLVVGGPGTNTCSAEVRLSCRRS